MKKSGLLSVIVTVSFLLLPVYAGGQEYDNIDDFRITPLDGGKTAKITCYAGTSQVVRIPPVIHGMTVTEIGEEAFMKKEIISVTIPDSVKIIGDKAFYDNRIINLTIPDSVTVIGKYAFALEDVYNYTSNTSLPTLGPSDHDMKSLTLGKSVTTIKERAFYGNRLKNVVIPDSVVIIEKGAFSYTELTNITIGAGVKLEIASSSDKYHGIELDILRGTNYPFSNGFDETYNNSGKLAGTYTRPDADSKKWSRQENR